MAAAIAGFTLEGILNKMLWKANFIRKIARELIARLNTADFIAQVVPNYSNGNSLQKANY
ncbi:hypothetical protein FVR03_06155 [Pontibacter qinzhouensis]|uniref:Uncharacterized protein n=1 Tax=Pontibacter qinzhouensis TaxID=2603253 RepID=A0A5C8KBY1_9BACT|nr:hypothetical protein [Pontibacter qinzhouensis]TXK49672.1 hypothetical protein FVR03_06155 [Pontibacter qinzhouensis]